MGFGFVVARFGLFLREIAPASGGQVASSGASRWFGLGLLALGIVVTALAFIEHVVTVRRFQRGETFVGRPTLLGGALTVVLILAGMLMTAYLFTSA